MSGWRIKNDKPWQAIAFSVLASAAFTMLISPTVFGQNASPAAKPVAKKTRQEKSRKAANVSTKNPTKSSAKQPSAAELNRREQDALSFANKHHPELVSLLERLKSENKAQYIRAVRELAAASDRIGKLKERFPERHAHDLENWKLGSRIRLILARLQMADPSEVDDLRRQLTSLVKQQTANRLAKMFEEKSKLELRLKKIDDAINEIESDQAAYVAKETKRLDRTLAGRKDKSKDKTKGTPASKPSKKSIASSRRNSKADSETKTGSRETGETNSRPSKKSKQKATPDNQK